MAVSKIPHSVISRKDARAKGLTRFFTGVPCPAGHTDQRSTANGGCLTCGRQMARERRGSDLARIERLQMAKMRPLPESMIGRPVVTRVRAIALGLPRYWTGAACVNGHFAERMTKGKQCLGCHREGAARRRATDPAKDAAIKAESYKRHRDEVIAKVEAYAAANREKVRKCRKAYRERNKEAIAERMKAWAKANPDKRRVGERRRRAQEAGAEGSHTLAEVKVLEVKQGGKCAAPGCQHRLADGYHVDHVVPLARGGSDYISNIALLCPFHNLSKHARDPIEWAQSLGQLL